MEELYKTIQRLCENKGITGGKMCTDIGLSRSFLTELKKGRAKSITLGTAKKLSDYFGCDISLFIKDSAESNEHTVINKEQLKFALFNGDKEITDDMLNEVLNFAEYIKQREADKHDS